MQLERPVVALVEFLGSYLPKVDAAMIALTGAHHWGVECLPV